MTVPELLVGLFTPGYVSAHASSGPAVLLTDLLTPERVLVPIAAGDKPGVLGELAAVVARTGGGARAEVLRAVEERESVLSTGIGFGIAIPHGRSAAIPHLVVAAGVTASPVGFDAIDGEPVRVVFLIVGPEEAAGQHVKTLSRIVRLVRHETTRARLLAARTPVAFCAALAAAEAS